MAILLALRGVVQRSRRPISTHALARLAADSFAETEKAIAEIAASGAPAAAGDPAALWPTGACSSALLARPSALRIGAGAVLRCADRHSLLPRRRLTSTMVRINNRLRGVIEAALGSLTLLSPDAGKRLAAAEAVFKSTRREAACRRSRRRSPQEKNARVQAAP